MKYLNASLAATVLLFLGSCNQKSGAETSSIGKTIRINS